MFQNIFGFVIWHCVVYASNVDGIFCTAMLDWFQRSCVARERGIKCNRLITAYLDFTFSKLLTVPYCFSYHCSSYSDTFSFISLSFPLLFIVPYLVSLRYLGVPVTIVTATLKFTIQVKTDINSSQKFVTKAEDTSVPATFLSYVTPNLAATGYKYIYADCLEIR